MTDAAFLDGGGAAGALMRAHDWQTTPLGPPEGWPQPLKTLVGVMLAADQPMFVAWGPEHILLYNDRYAPMLADRHPRALGRSFFDVWHEVREALTPLVDQVFAGEPVHMADITLLLDRPGRPREAHFAFSYTPVRDEAGTVAGLFCPCTETTGAVLAERRRAQEAERQRQLFGQMPGFVAVLSGPTHVFDYVNDAYVAMTGARDFVGRGVREVFPELDGQGFFELLDRVYASGEPFTAQALPVHLAGEAQPRAIDLLYQPIRDDAGIVTGIFAGGYDVTERVRAEAELRGSEARLRAVIDAAPIGLVFADASGRITGGNAHVEHILGHAVLPSPDIDAYGEWVGFHPGGRRVEGREYPLAQVVAGADHAELEVLYRRGDGRDAWVRFIASAIRGEDGQPVGGVVASLDVDRERRAELALRELNADLERRVTERALSRGRTWQLSPEIMGVINAQGVFESANPAWATMLGWSEEEVASRPFFDFIHPDDIARTQAVWADLVDRELPALHFENRYRHKDGGWRWLSWVAVPDDAKVYCSARDITEDKERAQALAARTAERDRLWRNTQDIQVVIDGDGTFRAINPAFTTILGWSPDEVIGRTVFHFVIADDKAPTGDALAHARRDVLPTFENRYRHKDGSFRCISWVAAPEDALIYASGRNITAEKQQADELAATQEALRQAQKMEAVGQLTGGIAHDFNNLLTGVIGSLDMMQRRMAKGETDRVERYIAIAMTSANRAAALTHRLLAFSRRQPLDPRPVGANRLVTGMEELLRRTIGEAIALEIVTAGGLWQTLCDPHQLESAILNLAINARDAMPDGGHLTIETCNAHLDSAYAAQTRDVRPGQYVCICVTDTGTGMDKDTIAKVFEPFFTTKPIGQGTGLGLSMIYGFARQSEGYARIYSEVGQGTTVKLYLPRYYGEAEEADETVDGVADAPLAEDGEVVLVVEDEAAVRDLVVDLLGDLGYRAVEAADGPAGLKLLQSDMRVDLLVTDIGLPGLNGRQLADAARVARPDLKVLFMTGYAENATLANGFLEPGMEMITKPFAVEALATRIRDMLEAG
ncbi:PAS domain-containing protein [Sphingomonas sp.]|uniref:hybrid sensor histidine kinase/response regulator n=1 Tax=Sphingomonas sp. TaxID=28214 RepID=UPI0035BC2923